jgi:hypothetical protein
LGGSRGFNARNLTMAISTRRRRGGIRLPKYATKGQGKSRHRQLRLNALGRTGSPLQIQPRVNAKGKWSLQDDDSG